MKPWQIGLSALAIAIIVPVGCSVVSVVTAPSRVVSRTLETDNIISNYQYFHDASQNFVSRAAQVQQYKGFIKEETDKQELIRLRTEMAGIQQSCRDLAAEYNSRSAQVNRNIFKGTDTPVELNASICE